MTENEFEETLREKDLNAPRLTPLHIEASIALEDYYVFPGTTVTVCCLTLQNGFNAIGSSACVSPENFDSDIGRKVAFEDARRKIWELEGYLLKDKLWKEARNG